MVRDIVRESVVKVTIDYGVARTIRVRITVFALYQVDADIL